MVLPDDNYGYFSNNPSQIQIQNTIFSCFRPYSISPKNRLLIYAILTIDFFCPFHNLASSSTIFPEVSSNSS